MSKNKSGNKSWLKKITRALTPNTPNTRQDLIAFLHAAHNNKLLDSDALTIIESAIQVTDLQVRDIMVSRSQMVTIKASHSLTKFLPTIIKSAHSRFPVLEDDMETVVGILLAKDLLPYVLNYINGQKEEIDIRKLLRPATYVPESKRVNVLFREFRATHNHMAIVVDEYGGVAGLVTIEDILEQIVGDIEDEHDNEEIGYIRPQPNGDFIVKGQTPTDIFNKYFTQSPVPDTVGNTIAEVIVHHFGYLPRRNETVTIGDLRFRVLTADSRKIHLLRITQLKS